jgi:hypothetical protein
MSPHSGRAFRFGIVVAAAMTVLGTASARAFEPGDDQYPNSIMAPEPGSRQHGSRLWHQHAQNHGKRAPAVAEHYAPHRKFAARGSPGVVLPTPLPKTQLIPPEGSGTVTTPNLPQEQGPTVVPGLARSVPNLPHGAESFQDRASRCAFQSGLYGVPGGANTRYIGACVQ